MVTCQICQREFSNMGFGTHLKYNHQINSKQYYDKYLKKDNEGICPECGKETNYIGINKGYFKYCSNYCAQTSNETLNTIKQTYLKKYGVEHPSKMKEFQHKIKQTNLKKYGVEHNSQVQEFKDKFKQTNLERYGVEHPNKSKEIKNKSIKTRLNNYYNNKILKLKEVKPLFSVNEYKGNRKNNKDIVYKWQCKKCGNIFEDSIHSKTPRCLICHPLLSGFSKQEKDVLYYIKSIYSSFIIENTREIIPPYELDIYLPDLNLAIEYNGNYWHSLKQKGYHRMKTNLCKQQGIKLLHIAESDWTNKPEYIKEQINNLIYSYK